MLDSKDKVDQALSALSARLEFAKAPKTEIAVCGGAALFLKGFMTRQVTQDIDAFAMVDRNPDGSLRLVKKKPLPEYLLHEAQIVAKDLGLPDDWINAGPADIVDLGLPAGLEARLHRIEYGSKLTVYLLDRIDQIHFKLYAATDQGPDSRHMADLVALRPTSEEIEKAARWSMTHDISEGYKAELKACLVHLGYADVARRV
jgi:hypothetical protein